MARISWRLVTMTTLMDLVGLVWILQGLGVLEGSPMTRDPMWVGAGIVLMVVSGLVLAFGILRSGRADTPP